jgi:hypothetical protein
MTYTSRHEAELRLWASEQPEKPFFIDVCDTFDYENYPVHCSQEELAEEVKKHDNVNMQRVEGVYKKDEKEGFIYVHRDGTPVH